jgi:crotonobetainyl-CoA:carnitine CoA-transferase CaiB-like acyl-CoA transferase
MDVTGEPGGPPSLMGASIGDTVPGLWAAYGIMLALQHRALTGLGQHVDIAMYDTLVMHNDMALPFYNLTGKVAGRDREDMWSAQLRLLAADGYVVLSGSVAAESWAKLWHAAGRADLAGDSRYLGQEIDGPFLLHVVRPQLEEWTRHKQKKELCSLLLEFGFSAGMVQTAEDVFRCPQLAARDMFHEFEFAGNRFRQPGDPVKLSNAASDRSAPPPRLGQHNDEIFGDLLGLEENELKDLRDGGAI